VPTVSPMEPKEVCRDKDTTRTPHKHQSFAMQCHDVTDIRQRAPVPLAALNDLAGIALERSVHSLAVRALKYSTVPRN